MKASAGTLRVVSSQPKVDRGTLCNPLILLFFCAHPFMTRATRVAALLLVFSCGAEPDLSGEYATSDFLGSQCIDKGSASANLFRDAAKTYTMSVRGSWGVRFSGSSVVPLTPTFTVSQSERSAATTADWVTEMPSGSALLIEASINLNQAGTELSLKLVTKEAGGSVLCTDVATLYRRGADGG